MNIQKYGQCSSKEAIAELFAGLEDTMINSCLYEIMGEIFGHSLFVILLHNIDMSDTSAFSIFFPSFLPFPIILFLSPVKLWLQKEIISQEVIPS